MTALTCYMTQTASTTLTTADTLLANASTGGALSNKNTNLTSGTTGWVEVYSQGNATSQTGAGSEPAPSGHGWLLDSTLLEGSHFQAGTWTFTLGYETGTTGTFITDSHYRAYQRSSAGVYTLIGEAVITAQTIISTGYTVLTASVSASASNTFAVGDKLYIDNPTSITTNGTTGTLRMQASSSATLGNVNAQVVTPGYVSSTTVQKKFPTRLSQYAVSQRLFKTRLFQMITADKKFPTRLNLYDYDKRYKTRLFQFSTADKKFPTRLKQVGGSQRLYATRFGQYDPQSTAQMLYDDLQVQYARLRSSVIASQIALLAIVYYVPAQILSEHAIPGELDVLLVGENIATDIHVLQTVQDVTNFIEANMSAQTIFLQTPTLITAGGNTSTLPVGSYKELAVDISITAQQGTSPTIQFFVDRVGADGVTYNLWTSSVISSSSAKVSTSLGAGLSSQSLGSGLQFRWAIGGSSTPGFTYSVSLIAR